MVHGIDGEIGFREGCAAVAKFSVLFGFGGGVELGLATVCVCVRPAAVAG
jgi:hypothetical protein